MVLLPDILLPFTTPHPGISTGKNVGTIHSSGDSVTFFVFPLQESQVFAVITRQIRVHACDPMNPACTPPFSGFALPG
ncbi:MAG: hypothetical protein WC382_01140 [Methanoregulaceae archaeon]